MSFPNISIELDSCCFGEAPDVASLTGLDDATVVILEVIDLKACSIPIRYISWIAAV